MTSTSKATANRAADIPQDTSPPQAEPCLVYLVGGMDCASCTKKVEKMVANLAGTEQVKTSFSQQTLQLQLDEKRTSRQTLEHNLRALGYQPQLQTSADASSISGASGTSGATINGNKDNPTTPTSTTWTGHLWHILWQSNLGKLVMLTGSLLIAAWLTGFFAPQYAEYAYILATLLGLGPFVRKVWTGIRLGDPFGISTLMTLAAVGALFIGEATEGALVVFLFTVGELLESVAAGRARQGIQALAALTPKTALLVEGKKLREVSVSQLEIGQIVQVNAGARVPADGVILSGSSELDDSPVTGESVPVFKSKGGQVYAGSISTDGTLQIRVEKSASDNTIARILHMVEEAEASKAPTARFIDRFSRYYTPAVIVVAALVAVLPPLLWAQPWEAWIYKGLTLLLIGCPCALLLSVPAAITSGISIGTRRGLLIKGGAALEAMSKVRIVAFDKTGTLTAGQPRVTDVIPVQLSENNEVLRLAAALEQGSSHPLAKAISKEAQKLDLDLPATEELHTFAGRGVSARIDGQMLSVSAPRHVLQNDQHDQNDQHSQPKLQEQIQQLESQGKTVVVLHNEQDTLGLLALRDEPREDAHRTISDLAKLNILPVMLTGDNTHTAHAIARSITSQQPTSQPTNQPPHQPTHQTDLSQYLEVQAELLPADKLRIVQQLHANGTVAMVGDGINDAPALAQADVGIAMGGGTDVALETANAALLHERVSGVIELIELSRATMANIKQNIAFALGLKAIFLLTTLFGVTNLWMAILADTGATVLVTVNALRLLRWKSSLQSLQDAPSTSDLHTSHTQQVA